MLIRKVQFVTFFSPSAWYVIEVIDIEILHDSMLQEVMELPYLIS